MVMSEDADIAYRTGYTKAMVDIVGWCDNLMTAADLSMKECRTEYNLIREQRWKDACEAVKNFANTKMEMNK